MKRHAGFTLVEVLIAMLVLAVGLLGLAALQTTSLKNNLSAYSRSQATQLAYDLSDRMRANAFDAKLLVASAYLGAAAQVNCTPLAECTPAQMAQNDLFEWNNAVSALPSGVGIVCLDSTPAGGTPALPGCDGLGSTYAIKIWWDDDRSGAASQQFVVSFQL